MRLLRNNLSQVLIIGALQGLVGLVATSTLRAFVENSNLRDLGIILLWLVVIVAGAWIVGRRLTPELSGWPGNSEVVAQEEEVSYVNISGEMGGLPGVREKYPNLTWITPPSVVEALGDYIAEFYLDRRLNRPDDLALVGYDVETLMLYEEEFEDAVEIAKRYLATKGVDLDASVSDAKSIRALARRLKAASDSSTWTHPLRIPSEGSCGTSRLPGA